MLLRLSEQHYRLGGVLFEWLRMHLAFQHVFHLILRNLLLAPFTVFELDHSGVFVQFWFVGRGEHLPIGGGDDVLGRATVQREQDQRDEKEMLHAVDSIQGSHIGPTG